MTGSKIVNRVIPNPGKLLLFFVANCSASSAGGSVCIRLPINLPNRGPAIMAVGIPTIREYRIVLPKSALNASMAIMGAG
ncbi:hypothetical protein D3C76_1804230 [compost metagenome]